MFTPIFHLCYRVLVLHIYCALLRECCSCAFLGYARLLFPVHPPIVVSLLVSSGAEQVFLFINLRSLINHGYNNRRGCGIRSEAVSVDLKLVLQSNLLLLPRAQSSRYTRSSERRLNPISGDRS